MGENAKIKHSNKILTCLGIKNIKTYKKQKKYFFTNMTNVLYSYIEAFL